MLPHTFDPSWLLVQFLYTPTFVIPSFVCIRTFRTDLFIPHSDKYLNEFTPKQPTGTNLMSCFHISSLWTCSLFQQSLAEFVQRCRKLTASVLFLVQHAVPTHSLQAHLPNCIYYWQAENQAWITSGMQQALGGRPTVDRAGLRLSTEVWGMNHHALPY